MNIKYSEVIDKLIYLTKKDKIQWVYRDFDDPYYDINKDEFTCEYKITENKTIDIVITYHNFKQFGCNYYMKMYYNNKKPLKHINIGNAYHQAFNKIFDLFIFVKYYSVVKNEKYKKELIEKLLYDINNYKWKRSGDSFLSRLDNDPKRNGISSVISVSDSNLFFYIMNKNNYDQILDIINVGTINDNKIYKKIMKLGIYR